MGKTFVIRRVPLSSRAEEVVLLLHGEPEVSVLAVKHGNASGRWVALRIYADRRGSLTRGNVLTRQDAEALRDLFAEVAKVAMEWENDSSALSVYY